MFDFGLDSDVKSYNLVQLLMECATAAVYGVAGTRALGLDELPFLSDGLVATDYELNYRSLVPVVRVHLMGYL